MIVDDFSLGIDYDSPGSAAGAVLPHYRWYFMGLRISGGMGHGDVQTPLQLVFAQFVAGIIFIAFKHGLDGQKHDLLLIFKGLRKFLKGWESHPTASGSPVLEKIEIYDFTAVIC